MTAEAELPDSRRTTVGRLPTRAGLEGIRAAVSDRDSGVRSDGERPSVRGPEPQEMAEMMYLVSVIDGSPPGRGGSATVDEEAALDAFNERLQAEGHWVFAGGLGAPSSATVIDNRDGAALVTDGPFVESKEYLGGFWVIEAPDLDVALTLAAEGSKACNRKVEVRPVL